MLQLIKTTVTDLQTLFEFQADAIGIQMAAFTPENPGDKDFYIQKWTGIVNNPDILMQTIWVDDKITGSIVHFELFDETNVSYWIDRPLWGRGIATTALKEFLTLTNKRPLHGRVAFDNIGSQRVLEKCGFNRIAQETSFARARQAEIVEFVYRLE